MKGNLKVDIIVSLIKMTGKVKVLIIGIIAGIIEVAVWYFLSDTKEKLNTIILLFVLYTAAYVIIAELERNIPEDDGVKYETAMF
jgi:hypothetical protein